MGNEIIEATQIGIATILRNYTLRVDPNQREYSWTKREVTALFQDLYRAIDEGEDTYFLGSIVSIPEPNSNLLQIIDGQQRLATTAILIAAIRDYLITREADAEVAGALNQDFLRYYDRGKRDQVSRLRLNSVDHEFFMRCVIDAQPRMPRVPASHHRIAKAARYAKEHVFAVIEGHAQKTHSNVLNAWVNYLENKAQVVLLKVPSASNAYRMFETLNDRGLRTTQADLVKNHLFGESGSRLKEAHEKWSGMRAVLESFGDKDILDYLRQMLISQDGYVRKEDVYAKASAQSRGESRAIAFLTTLEAGAVDYAALLNPEHEKWNEYPPTVRQALTTLATVRMGFMRPILLAIARRFSPKEADRAFRVVIRLTVRFIVAGGAKTAARSGTVEEALAEVAKKIATGGIRTAAGLLKEIESHAPKDAKFTDAFATAASSKPQFARYYLQAMESKWKRLPHPLYLVDDKRVTLEHVLPIHPGTAWPQFTDDDAETYSRRFGNLALLETKLNSDLRSEAFETKKKVYAKSVSPLTQQLASYEAWTKDQINERQRALAELAAATWPLSAD